MSELRLTASRCVAVLPPPLTPRVPSCVGVPPFAGKSDPYVVFLGPSLLQPVRLTCNALRPQKRSLRPCLFLPARRAPQRRCRALTALRRCLFPVPAGAHGL